MSCAHSMYRIPLSDLTVSNLWHRYSSRIHNDGVIIQRSELDFVKTFDERLFDKIQPIPCGDCVQCRLAHSQQWACRCVAEASLYDQCNSFLTLTYDDSHLSFGKHYDYVTGEVDIRPVLVKKDLQDFMKRLRRYYDYHHGMQNIRFFACGEYGDLRQRPHFHVLLFNCEFDKLHVWENRGQGYTSFTSDVLDDLWKNGIATVGPVDWNTSAYTSRYVMKKADKGNMSERIHKALKRWALDDFAPYRFPSLLFQYSRDELGMTFQQSIEYWKTRYIPDDAFQYEYTDMSRRPGIGNEYYQQNKNKIYKTDEVFLPGRNGVVQALKPPKYYDKLFDVEYPDKMELIKNKRVFAAKNAMSDKLSRTDLSEEEYLLMQERSAASRAAKLVRTLE